MANCPSTGAQAASERVRVLDVEAARRDRNLAFVVPKADQLRAGPLSTLSGGVASDRVTTVRL
jgi:hypothetical protein